MKIRSGMTLETDELIEALTQEEAEQLIKDIDLAMADYDFTERIAKHLIQALADECKAGCEEFDFSALSPNVEAQGREAGSLAERPSGAAG